MRLMVLLYPGIPQVVYILVYASLYPGRWCTCLPMPPHQGIQQGTHRTHAACTALLTGMRDNEAQRGPILPEVMRDHEAHSALPLPGYEGP